MILMYHHSLQYLLQSNIFFMERKFRLNPSYILRKWISNANIIFSLKIQIYLYTEIFHRFFISKIWLNVVCSVGKLLRHKANNNNVTLIVTDSSVYMMANMNSNGSVKSQEFWLIYDYMTQTKKKYLSNERRTASK